MSSELYEQIRNNPTFHELVTRRGRFAWTLTIISLVLFYGFVLAVAFTPAALGQPIAEGAMMTVGVAAEMFMFVFFWLMTAFYVYTANSQYDDLTNQIVRSALKGKKS